MAANEGSKYTNFSNVEIGTSSGGGGLKIAGKQINFGTGTITGATTVATTDNGKVFFVSGTGAAITLPAVTNTGFRAKFVVSGAIATSSFAITSAEGDNMEGSVIVAGAVVDVDAADVVNFVHTAENIGDFVEVISDGTSWHVFGNALNTGGITATG